MVLEMKRQNVAVSVTIGMRCIIMNLKHANNNNVRVGNKTRPKGSFGQQTAVVH